LGILLICTAVQAHSAGFAIMEQGGKELGQAFAGATTNIEDASSVFFNPGALGQIHGRLVSLAGHLVLLSPTFDDDGSRSATGARLSGGEGGDAGELTIIPNLYYAHELTPRLVFGLGLSVPFGVNTEYDPDWKGRYHAIDTELTTVNLSPALAVRLNDRLSLGAGIDVQYMRAQLSNALDFGTICLRFQGVAQCREIGLIPQGADGLLEIEADSLAWGYHLGALYAFSPDTRVGIAYRSKLGQELEGDADFSVPTAATFLTRRDLFTDRDVRADIDLPDSLALGFFHRFHPRWAVSADVLWMRWSRFKELRFRFEPPQPESILPQNWQNTWRYALGLTWLRSPSWNLRVGIAYDETPVPSAEFRSARAPDNDRLWVAAGASYKFSDRGTLHLGYAHLFIHDPYINNLSPTRERLLGEYETDANILSAQLDWQF
jgi:long-chain fatty acid transport protein